MSDAAFENVMGGKLKFKSGGPMDIAPAIGKKRRKKRKKKALVEAVHVEESSTKEPEADVYVDTMTTAERRHAEEMERREKQLIKNLAAKTHREKIEDFNKKLEEWTDHHDIPKIQSAGLG